MNSLLDIDALHCGYDTEIVVHDFSLQVAPGMLSCLLGPSGCGKTTVLRAVAGFEPVRAGSIRLRGTEVSRPGWRLPAERRGLGMVFQDYALFPHLRVGENIAFGLRGSKASRQHQVVGQLLELLGMAGSERRYPHELSGGQQQRVALARALAPEPDLLLLDEPFSNLDVELRERLVGDVRDILRERGTAALFVTHDQHEAFAMGERVGVMHGGRIVQWDTPFNLYHEPVNRFVADFIGQGRLLPGRLQTPDTVDTPVGTLRGDRAYPWPQGSNVEVLLRPDDIFIVPDSRIKATITERAFRGAETMYTLRLGDGLELLSLMPSHEDYAVGAPVSLEPRPEHLVLFEVAQAV